MIDETTSHQRGRTPTSCCSRLCLLWPWQYIRKGFTHSLSSKDMPLLPKPYLSTTLFPVALKEWKRMIREDTKTKPSVLNLILTLHRKTFLWGISFGAVQGFLNASARPL